MSTLPTPQLDDAIQVILDRGDLASAAVVVASTPNASISNAYGTRYDDRPASAGDIVPLYCSAKPVLSVVVLSLIQDGKTTLATPVETHLDWLRGHWIGALTIEDLLTHNNNLHRVGAVVPVAMEPAKRGPMMKHLPPQELEGSRGYSDFAGWFFLAHIVEAITGEDFRDVVLARVNHGYDIEERNLNLGIPQELFDEWRGDISVNLYTRNETSRHPLAAEAARIWACEWNAPNSAYGTAPGLVQFYEGILADVEGAGKILSPELAQTAITAGETFYDHRLKRDASYGLGLMVNMELFRLGPSPSERSFGHVGVGGGSVAFADPAHGLAAAVMLNTVFDEGEDLLDLRASVVTALYSDLGLAPNEQVYAA